MDVLQCLATHGQRLDAEIARETGMPLDDVRAQLVELEQSGHVITCHLTRFERGRRLEFLQCRISGYHPPKAPGRKPS